MQKDEQQIHMDQPSTVSPPTQTQPGVVFLESPYGENNPTSENNIIQADDINNASLTATIHVDQECPSAPIHELSSQRDDGAPSLYTSRENTPSGTSIVYATPPVSPNTFEQQFNEEG